MCTASTPTFVLPALRSSVCCAHPDNVTLLYGLTTRKCPCPCPCPWSICTRADLSSTGLSGSCGLMVNYLYDLSSVATNNQQYLLEHHINAAPAVQELLL
jgi:hypothetical protein